MKRSQFATLSGLYVITDEVLMPGRTHLDVARAAVSGGAIVVQLRDKRASDTGLLDTARAIRRLTREAGVLFIVNDRLDLARAVEADGVHLGQADLPARDARRLWPDGILGISVSDVESARRAEDAGADYLGVGPVFATRTKEDAGPALGLDGLARIRAASRLPIAAIGGIGLDNVADVAAAGAEFAAVISAVVCASDMQAATASLCAAFADGAARRRRSAE